MEQNPVGEQGVAEVQAEPQTIEAVDPQAKKMGPAKSGGTWHKNYHTGTLYRVQDGKVVETKKSAVAPAVAKKQLEQHKVAKVMADKAKEPKKGKKGKKGKKEASKVVKSDLDKANKKMATEAKQAGAGDKGESRATLMQRAKDLGIKYFRILSKSELAEVLSYGNEPSKADTEKISKIIEAAKKRWQDCPFFQKKTKKV